MNELINIKKLISKIYTWRSSRFLYISLPPLHYYDVTRLNWGT